MKKITLLNFILCLFFISKAQNVYFADFNFEQALLNHNPPIDLDFDGIIQVSEAMAFNGDLVCSNALITDLTGIEEFININSLNCSDNNLVSLDVSQNSFIQSLECQNNNLISLNTGTNFTLQTLYCFTNSLTALDVSQNTGLQFLIFDDNDIAFLDVTSNTDLVILSLSNNLVGNLDVTQNTLLDIFNCDGNGISSLDLTQNTFLVEFDCSDNSLSSLDLTQNTSLEFFNCALNQLNSLDISQNTSLSTLNCNNNTLASLDLTNNTALLSLDCSSNNLDSLNVANGNNTIIGSFDASNNSMLNCIQVDNAAWSTSNWFSIDAGVSFNENCYFVFVSSIMVDGQNGDSTITTSGGTLQMNATVLPSTATDATYTWSVMNGTGTATISTSGLLTATTDGTVDVTATANDGSGVTGSKTIAISNQSVGINDFSFESLNVYPNPTTNFINIDTEETITSIKLTDLTGKLIDWFNPGKKQLNVSELTAGVYLLEIANTEKKSIIKVIKK